MSCVTNILLLTMPGEPGVQTAQGYLIALDQPQLVEVSRHTTGPKAFEGEVWIGAFNYFDLDRFCTGLRAVIWEFPECVQLLVKGDSDDVFEVIQVVEWMR